MPVLKETIGQDLSGYVPVEKSDLARVSPPSPNKEPGYNTFLRCPLPPVWQTTPDSLRQYYQNNIVPQVRLFNPPTIVSSGNSTTVSNVISAGGGGSSGGGGGTTTATLSIVNTSIKTPAINAGNKFIGSFSLSKAFELLSITASSPCRIQLYGTLAAQSADNFRPIDVSPPAGTGQNIICDIVLDTSPFIWTFQNREGANGDNPVSSTVYITVTNIDAITDVITLSLSYIPVVN